MNTNRKVVLGVLSSVLVLIIYSPTAFAQNAQVVEKILNEVSNQSENQSNTIKKNDFNFERRKKRVSKLIDRLIHKNEKLKKRIVKNKEIYSKFESSLFSDIDSRIYELNQLQIALNTTSDIDSLKKIWNRLNNLRNGYRKNTIRQMMILSNLNQYERKIDQKLENRINFFERKINSLKDDGENVQELENLFIQLVDKSSHIKDQIRLLKTRIIYERLEHQELINFRKSLRIIYNEVHKIYVQFDDLLKQI